MSIIKSRHIWTLLLLLTVFFVPLWGQSQAGSNIASRTLLSSDGNRLTGVTESVADYDFTGSFEYKRLNGSQYIYNGNGSLVADRSRGIAYIAYDLNNSCETGFLYIENITTNGASTQFVECRDKGRRIFTNEDFNATSGINDFRATSGKTNTVSSDYHDLQGRRLSGQPQRGGVYIQNGKKILK